MARKKITQYSASAKVYELPAPKEKNEALMFECIHAFP